MVIAMFAGFLLGCVTWLFWIGLGLADHIWPAFILFTIGAIFLFVAAAVNLCLLACSSYTCIKYKTGFGFFIASMVAPTLIATPFLLA